MTVTVSSDTPPTLREIAELVQDAGTLCIRCHEEYLGPHNIESYDHEGGIPVKGFDKPQWVYFRCERCDYCSALWKVLNEIEVKYMEANR